MSIIGRFSQVGHFGFCFAITKKGMPSLHLGAKLRENCMIEKAMQYTDGSIDIV